MINNTRHVLLGPNLFHNEVPLIFVMYCLCAASKKRCFRGAVDVDYIKETPNDRLAVLNDIAMHAPTCLVHVTFWPLWQMFPLCGFGARDKNPQS